MESCEGWKNLVGLHNNVFINEIRVACGDHPEELFVWIAVFGDEEHAKLFAVSFALGKEIVYLKNRGVAGDEEVILSSAVELDMVDFHEFEIEVIITHKEVCDSV